MAEPVIRGWFHRPGIQAGDRTLEEQMQGLEPLMAEIRSGVPRGAEWSGPRKPTVLDLGCAEGLISQKCIEAGAASVIGLDVLQRHIDNAQSLGLDPHRARFAVGDMNKPPDEDEKACCWADIVLMLAVLHKLRDPEKSLREWAQFAGSLLVIRLPLGSDGVVAWKHGSNFKVDTRQVLPELGFVLERDEAGPRGERVHYWRRAA